MADKLISQVIADNPELFAGLPVSTATSAALNSKQATLVSGTNIKTINGSTVLGAGNIAFPTLFKTINGNVITGTGDVTINSGGSADDPLAVTSGLGGPNVQSGRETVPNNSIDPATISCSAFGGSTSGPVNTGANSIGKNIPANVFPVYTSGSNNNAADTAVSGRANYSQVFGYDNIANGLMSIIFGSHSTTYNASSHPIIIGSQSSIQGAADASVVLGNINAIIGASYSAVLSGIQNLIDSTGNYNTIMSGGANRITGTSSFSMILGGSNITLTDAERCLTFGETITYSAGRIHAYAVGKNLNVLNNNSLTFGGGALVSGGSQRSIVDHHIYTTDATPTYSYGFDTEDGQHIAGQIKILCRNVTDNKVSYFVIPVAAKNTSNVVAGSTASGANVVRASETLAEDTFGVNPFVDFSIGVSKLFVKFQGLAGKTIHWRIEHDLSVVK